MGLPLCRTEKEMLQAPTDSTSHEVGRGDTVTVHATGYQRIGGQLFWSTRQKRPHPESGEMQERGCAAVTSVPVTQTDIQPIHPPVSQFGLVLAQRLRSE